MAIDSLLFKNAKYDIFLSSSFLPLHRSLTSPSGKTAFKRQLAVYFYFLFHLESSGLAITTLYHQNSKKNAENGMYQRSRRGSHANMYLIESSRSHDPKTQDMHIDLIVAIETSDSDHHQH